VTELSEIAVGTSAEDIQTTVYEVGKRNDFEPLRDWFKALYQVLLGQDQGPRFGSFVALYGLSESIALINRALRAEDLTA
jgi:lysyl-tRNA synthetase class 1